MLAAFNMTSFVYCASGLGGAYEDAWQEWATDGDGDVWDVTINDGLA